MLRDDPNNVSNPVYSGYVVQRSLCELWCSFQDCVTTLIRREMTTGTSRSLSLDKSDFDLPSKKRELSSLTPTRATGVRASTPCSPRGCHAINRTTTVRARASLLLRWTRTAAVRLRGHCTCLVLSARAALAIGWCTGAPWTPRTHLRKKMNCSFRQCSDCNDNRVKGLRVKVKEINPKCSSVPLREMSHY